jgi:4-hydroxyacetophenone monooxygenase
MAIEGANLNALRLALYQLTGDPDLLVMGVEPLPLRGGAYFGRALKAEHAEQVKEKALQYLRDHLGEPWPAPPTHEETDTLIERFVGEKWPENRLKLGYEELAFEEFPRGVAWTNPPPREKLRDFQVLVVGAGISGIAAAVQLKRLGIPFVVVERLHDIGGTWLLNDYPEVRVDVPSEIFQFTFTKRHEWLDYFATGNEVLEYLDKITREHGIRDNILLSTAVTAGSWDEDSACWVVTLQGPDGERVLRPNIVISACGLFNTPNEKPPIPGIDEFEGGIFHTAAWDHSCDWRDKRVAVIGNGSSGAQLMPAIAEQAASLTVYQRNPQWIGPMMNLKEPVPAAHHWLSRNFPYYWNWSRFAGVVPLQNYQDLHVLDPEWQAEGGLINERNDTLREMLTRYIREQMGDDADLLAKVLPKYPPMVRRLVADNGWYKALRKEHVELVTEPIERFTSTGIRTADGVTRDFDVIVLALGFQVSKFLWPVQYVGRNGTSLESIWNQDGARAYLSLAMPGFPNLFTFYGPNSQPRGGAALHSTAEAWTRYTLKIVVAMIEGDFNSVEVRRDVFESYNARLDTAMRRLIWEMEGRSYYVNEHGRVVTNIPWEAEDYLEMLREPSLNDYHIK